MIAGGAWRTSTPVRSAYPNASSTEVGKRNDNTTPSTHMIDLTQENMAKHEKHCGGNLIYYRTNGGVADPAMPEDAGIFMIGGVSPSTAARPRTCGLALAMVAIFCYFPGVSMVVSISTVGITNKTVTGIVFVSVAVTLTILSGILCLRGRCLSRKVHRSSKNGSNKVKKYSKLDPHATHSSKALLSSRDDFCETSRCNMQKDNLCECEDIAITDKIAQSFALSRYFDNLYAVNGPFDLDHEMMDKVTENSIRGRICSFPNASHAKQAIIAHEMSSSIDSAIGIDSDVPSLEGVIVV